MHEKPNLDYLQQNNKHIFIINIAGVHKNPYKNNVHLKI